MKIDVKVDWKDLAESTRNALLASLRGLVEGGQEDLALFGQKIADRLVQAVQLQDEAKARALIDELKGQAGLIAEINRIRAVHGGWDLVAAAVGGVGHALLGILGSVKF